MAPKPIITPGPTPQGPPGWEERQQERLTSGEHASGTHSPNVAESPSVNQATGSHDNSPSGAKSTLKDKLHKVGEKLAIVPPKDAEGGTATQNASTMPEYS